jgi:predicted membrane protein
MSDFDSKDYGDRLRREIHANVQDRIQRKMDRFHRKMERRHHRHSGGFGVLFGALLAGLGVLFLLQNLGILYFEDIWQYWPVILIVIGVSRAASSLGLGGRVAGGIMVFVGMIFLLQNLGIIHGNVWRYVWPMVLIIIGLGMLVRAVERHNMAPGGAEGAIPGAAPAGASADPTDTSLFAPWAIFSGVRRRVETQDFEGGEALAVFGGMQLDLSDAATKKDEIVIETNAFFGGIEMKVPENWNVSIRSSAIFGGIEDETSSASSTADAKRPLLIITGSVVFGGVTVKN